MIGAVYCGNGTKRGGVCRRWVVIGGECPHHGLPFVVKYPNLDDLFDQAVARRWREVSP